MEKSLAQRLLRAAGIGATAATKLSMRAAAATARAAATTTKRHESEIARAGRATTEFVGSAVNLVGGGLDSAGRTAARKLSESSRRSGPGGKLAVGALKLLAEGVSKFGEGVSYGGRILDGVAPAVGGTVGGIMTGATQTLSGVIDSAAITESDIQALQNKLIAEGRVSTRRSSALNERIRWLQQTRRKSELLDLLTIGGVSLANAARNPALVPDDVEEVLIHQHN